MISHIRFFFILVIPCPLHGKFIIAEVYFREQITRENCICIIIRQNLRRTCASCLIRSRKTVIHRSRIKRWFQIKRIIAKISQNNSWRSFHFNYILLSISTNLTWRVGPGDERLPSFSRRIRWKSQFSFNRFPINLDPCLQLHCSDQ